MSKGIYTSDWILDKKTGKKGSIRMTIIDVVVSGNDAEEIAKNDFYIRRVLSSLAKGEQKNIDKYRVIKVVLKKQIGTTDEL